MIGAGNSSVDVKSVAGPPTPSTGGTCAASPDAEVGVVSTTPTVSA